MIWLSDFLKREYGESLKKISIDAGFTCPNRDGTLGYGGCIFCSQKGSGDFTKGSRFSAMEQIDLAKQEYSDNEDRKYIAYFQAYTNTYGSIERLREIYFPIAHREDIAVISIATRPDCLGTEIVELIDELSQIKPVWIELGLQTVHEKTAEYIRRGYELYIYDDAVKRLSETGISQIITHVILGLPGETQEMMLDTVRYVGETCAILESENRERRLQYGIKLQLLHVLKDTDLEKEYINERFSCLSFEEYVDVVYKSIRLLPENMIVHRITGDGDKDLLIAPLWSKDKKRVMNAIRQKLMDDNESEIIESAEQKSNEIEYHVYEKISQENNSEEIIPVFLYGTAEDIPGDPLRLYNEIKDRTSDDFVIVAYRVNNWNNDFSPWTADNFAGNGKFGGNGKKTLNYLEEKLITEIKNRFTACGREIRIFPVGYSLAGLFSIWAYYERRNIFDGAICCSGSLWFSGYEEYLKGQECFADNSYMENKQNKGNDIIYFSLGGKESCSGNAVMDRVGEITKVQFECVKKDSFVSKCRYDINKGGHFADPVKRIAKGISWCLSVLK